MLMYNEQVMPSVLNLIYGQQTEFVFLVLTFDNWISKVKDHDFFGLIVLNLIDSSQIANHSMLLKIIDQHVWYVPNQGLHMFNALWVVFLGLFRQNLAYLYWITKGDINYGSLSCHAMP